MLNVTADRSSGFTLIEMVVAVAIIAVLSMMAAPLVELSGQRQKEAELRIALRQIREAIDAYHQAAIDKRIEVPADATGYPESLEVLVEGVPDIRKPDRPMIYFLRRLPRDPFHADGSVSAAKTWGKRSYASPPDDPIEGDDVYDIYSLAEDVGFNGVAYKEW